MGQDAAPCTAAAWPPPAQGQESPPSLKGQSPIGRMVVLGHCGFQDSATPFLRDLSLPRSEPQFSCPSCCSR